MRTGFGILYGLAAGLVLVAVASRLKPAVSEVLLAAIGATSVLYAVWDVASDVLFRHSGQSDAAALAHLTGVPARRLGPPVGDRLHPRPVRRAAAPRLSPRPGTAPEP